MNCTKLQYTLIIIIFVLMLSNIFQTNLNTNLNTNENTNLNTNENTNLNTNENINETNNYSNNYSNNTNSVIINNNNNNIKNSNLNNNSKNLKNSNLNNIIITDNNIFIDIKYILGDNIIKNVYTKNTISENLKNVLLYYLKLIISNIIDKTYFNLNDMERIYEEIDQFNNRRYVIVFFVYNLNYFNSNKLLIDFIINFDTQFIYLNNIKEFYNSYLNIINKYDRLIYNRAYLDNNTPEDDLNEILKDDYLKNYKYAYLSDTSLDFTNIFLVESDNKNLKELSTIYLPNTQIHLTENIFCDKYINGTWDKHGNLKKNTEDCILHNSSTTQNIDVPDKFPYFGSDKDTNYYWLIDAARNNIIRQHGYAI